MSVLWLAAAGCGSRSADERNGEPMAQGAAGDLAQGAAAIAAALDAGPRAAQTLRLEADQAARGEKLFADKACSACHTIGEDADAPDLRGVAGRRTAAWLRKQITEPEWMNQHDPITQQLVEQYGMEMADMDVSADEAEALLHYLLRENGDEGDR